MSEKDILDAFERGKAFGFAEGMRATRLRDLTDEKIRTVWYEHPEFKDGLGVDPIPFARSILREAQNK